MLILKIIGIVFAALILLVALILMLSVDIILRADEDKGFRILFRVLGITFGGKSKKSSAKKKEKEPMSKNLKKVLGIGHLEKDSMESNGLGQTLQETVELVKLVTDRVVWLAGKLRVPRCRVAVICGGEEAALQYGIACAVLYPMVGYLRDRGQLRQRGLDLQIGCDYARGKSLFELDLAVRIRVFHAVAAALHIVSNNLKKES